MQSSKRGWESGVKKTRASGEGGGRGRAPETAPTMARRGWETEKRTGVLIKPKRESGCPWGRFPIEFTRASEDISAFCL